MTKIALLFRISQIGVTISAIGMTIDLALSMGYLAAAMATFV